MIGRSSSFGCRPSVRRHLQSVCTGIVRPDSSTMRTNKESNMNKQRGFTLIEIMVVVALVAILAKIAFPMYTSYMARGKLMDAQATLTAARVAMEQYYQDHRTYSGGEAAVNATTAGACPLTTTYFSYACTTTASSFLITASSLANKGLGAAGAYVYTIDSSNAKATTQFAAAASTAACWITKPGQTC